MITPASFLRCCNLAHKLCNDQAERGKRTARLLQAPPQQTPVSGQQIAASVALCSVHAPFKVDSFLQFLLLTYDIYLPSIHKASIVHTLHRKAQPWFDLCIEPHNSICNHPVLHLTCTLAMSLPVIEMRCSHNPLMLRTLTGAV